MTAPSRSDCRRPLSPGTTPGQLKRQRADLSQSENNPGGSGASPFLLLSVDGGAGGGDTTSDSKARDVCDMNISYQDTERERRWSERGKRLIVGKRAGTGESQTVAPEAGAGAGQGAEVGRKRTRTNRKAGVKSTWERQARAGKRAVDAVAETENAATKEAILPVPAAATVDGRLTTVRPTASCGRRRHQEQELKTGAAHTGVARCEPVTANAVVDDAGAKTGSRVASNGADAGVRVPRGGDARNGGGVAVSAGDLRERWVHADPVRGAVDQANKVSVGGEIPSRFYLHS